MIVIAILIFSIVPLVIKSTVANSFTIGFFRLSITTILLALYWFKKIDWSAYKEKTFWKLIVIGLCFFGHWLTYMFSVKLAGPSLCVLGMATYGIQLIFYGAYFLGHQVTSKNIFCLLLILIGVVMVLPQWNLQDNATLGLILALISASFYAVIPIMLKKSHEFSQETRIFSQFFIALIGFACFIGETHWTALGTRDWWSLWFLAVLGTFVAHTLWSKSITRLPTTTTGIIYYLITPLTMALSWGIMGESLSVLQMAGGFLILSAALINILNQDRLKKLLQLFSYNKDP